MPQIMKELHKMPFDYGDGDGFDFEPYDEFLSETETVEWLQAWTGNDDIDKSEFLVFGMDGTGGYAAFWLKRPESKLTDQPIVFLGSEGEVLVLAQSFGDYLWLLAEGYGPCEVANEEPASKEFTSDFLSFAEKHSTVAKRSSDEILESANAEFPDFEEYIDEMCK